MNNSCLCIFIYLEVTLQYKFLVVGLMDWKVNVDVIFAGYCKVLFYRSYVIYIPIISVWECLFSHSPANRHYCQILRFCQSDMREMVSQCHFNLHLSILSDIEYLFVCLVVMFTSHFVNGVLIYFAHSNIAFLVLLASNLKSSL